MSLRQNISFTPTLSAYDHYAASAVPFMQKTIRRAAELNVPIVVGTIIRHHMLKSAAMIFLRK